MNQPRYATTGSGLRKSGIAAITIGVLLVLLGLRGVDLLYSRERTLQVAEARAANLAYILSEYVRESFAAGDASLRQLAIHSRRIGGPSAPADEWMPSLLSARVGVPNIGSISIVDADGIIRHSTQRAIIGQSRAKEYAFVRLSQSNADELVVSEPFETVLEPKIFIIPIARRLTNDAGTFEGIVVATMLPVAPSGLFGVVDVGRRGLVTVFHPNGIVLFREPAGTNPTGEHAENDPVFQAARASGTPGRVDGPLAPGGPIYLSAYHPIEAPPLLVAVSLEREEVLADWRRQNRILLALSLGVAGTLIGTLIVLFRQMDAKFRAEQEARLVSEEAGRLKEEFLMTVSHELRTPLQSILGWTHVLLAGKRGDPGTVKSALETIERNVNVQTKLIDDLLDVSRAVSGRLRLDPRPFEINELVAHVVETSRPAAAVKRIQLTLTTGAVTWLTADPDRVQQIVWNLVMNAIKFTMEAGRVDVHVTTPAGHIEIVVKDSGVGIPAEFLPHVFERFRQADGSTTRRYGGLGLGLAIVRHLTELHGGAVSAESEGEGKGATFRVRLPVTRAEAKAQD